MMKYLKIFLLFVLCLLFLLNIVIVATFTAMFLQSISTQSSIATFFEVLLVFIASPLATLISISLPLLHHRLTEIGIAYYLTPLLIFFALAQSFLLHGVPHASFMLSLLVISASAIYFYAFKIKIINNLTHSD